MKTTMSRLAGSLSVEEFNQFLQDEVVASEAFGTVEVLRRYDDGSIEVRGNLFLDAALSLGFRPEKWSRYGEGERRGTIWRVSPDTLYVSDNGIGSWWDSRSEFADDDIAIVKEFLEADEDDVEDLQERLDELGISFS